MTKDTDFVDYVGGGANVCRGSVNESQWKRPACNSIDDPSAVDNIR